MRNIPSTKTQLAELAGFRKRIAAILNMEEQGKDANVLAQLTKLLPLYLKVVELERELRTESRRRIPKDTLAQQEGRDAQTLSEAEWKLLADIIQSRNAGGSESTAAS